MKHEYWNDETKDAFRAVYADPYTGNLYEPFDNVEPALRFGWNQALDAEYPGESWEEVEEDTGSYSATNPKCSVVQPHYEEILT